MYASYITQTCTNLPKHSHIGTYYTHKVKLGDIEPTDRTCGKVRIYKLTNFLAQLGHRQRH